MIRKTFRILYYGVSMSVLSLVLGGVATCTGFIGGLYMIGAGFLGLPVTLLLASDSIPMISVPHCMMCKAKDHKACLFPRNSVFCCCTTEIDEKGIAEQEAMDKYAYEHGF